MSLAFQGASELIHMAGMAIQAGNAVGPQLGHWKNGKGRAHSPFLEAFQRPTCHLSWLALLSAKQA